MVDVGYCIDGKRGIISNVTQISNHATDHLVFAKDDEQYALKKTDIEYVIPHEEIKATSIPYVEPYVKSKTVLDAINEFEFNAKSEPKTNREKFEEVFGMPPKDNLSICDIVDCKRSYCDGCKFYRPWMMRDAWNGIWRGKES